MTFARLFCWIVIGLFGAMLLACGGTGTPSSVQDKAAIGRGFNRGENDLEGRTDSTPQGPIIETAEAALKHHFKDKVVVSGTSTVKILEAGKSWTVSGRYDSPIDKRHEFQSIIHLDADGKYDAGNLMLGDDIVMDKISKEVAKQPAKPKPTQDDIEDRQYSATSVSKDYVKKFLKHPHDANFGFWSIPDVKSNATGEIFYVESTVKAKNGFGAELTYKWATIVMLDDNTWKLVSCAIDDKKVYQDEGLLEKLAVRKNAIDRADQIAAKKAAAEQRREELAAQDELNWRTWTDASGKHKTEAKYSGVVSGKVTLIRRDGKKIQLQIDKLSEEDREWLESRAKR